MAVMEGDLAKKERCVRSRLFSHRPRWGPGTWPSLRGLSRGGGPLGPRLRVQAASGLCSGLLQTSLWPSCGHVLVS